MISSDEFVRNLNQGSRFKVERSQDDSRAYRLLPPRQSASGHVDGYFDYEKPCLTIRNLQAKEAFYDDEPGLGRLAFILHLSGSRRIEFGSTEYHFNQPTLAAFFQPVGLNKRSVWTRGDNELALSVGVWPDMLASLVGFYPMCFPDFGAHSPSGSEAFWYARPLPYSLMLTTEKLLSPGIHPSLLQNYISVKSQELLYLCLNTLMCDGDLQSRSDLVVNRVEYVKTMVNARLKNPPLLSELANTIQMSCSDLSNAFQAETGISYLQYVTERRMDKARLLLEGNQPLKHVAYEVGYQHTSNFCTAFKRHFGITPRDARGR